MIIEGFWTQVLIGIAIGAVLAIWRWPTSVFLGFMVAYAAYLGHWTAILLALFCAGEIVSAWTGRSWPYVIWTILRPNPIDRMTPGWKAAFERARKRDMRRNRI